jgi:hypothetical protein
LLVQNIVCGTSTIANTIIYTPNQEYTHAVSGSIVLELGAFKIVVYLFWLWAEGTPPTAFCPGQSSPASDNFKYTL